MGCAGFAVPVIEEQVPRHVPQLEEEARHTTGHLEAIKYDGGIVHVVRFENESVRECAAGQFQTQRRVAVRRTPRPGGAAERTAVLHPTLVRRLFVELDAALEQSRRRSTGQSRHRQSGVRQPQLPSARPAMVRLTHNDHRRRECPRQGLVVAQEWDLHGAPHQPEVGQIQFRAGEDFQVQPERLDPGFRHPDRLPESPSRHIQCRPIVLDPHQRR